MSDTDPAKPEPTTPTSAGEPLYPSAQPWGTVSIDGKTVEIPKAQVRGRAWATFVAILAALWAAVRPTLMSKKVQTAIVASIVALAARMGLELNSETVGLILSPFLAAILGQGIADAKKPAPCPTCAAAASSPPIATPATSTSGLDVPMPKPPIDGTR